MTRAGEQNDIDLGRIVDELNAVYACGGVDFVFVPGDIADDGSVVAYEAFRAHLDRLRLPWCAIVGDHDVHEGNSINFERFIARELHSSFSIGPYRFLRLNAFSVPRPDSFVLSEEQLQWASEELQQAETSEQAAVLLLHCYPSDLKGGRARLKTLLSRHRVLLVDMGHTHYNELSNDGRTLYSATRSTGQVEEGPVGYSVVTLDENCVSWHFVPLGSPSLVAITSPADERLRTALAPPLALSPEIGVHAKVWSRHKLTKVTGRLRETSVAMTSEDGIFWKAHLNMSGLPEGQHDLQVMAEAEDGELFRSGIRLTSGFASEPAFSAIDHENAIGEWSERGLLGTQLGPNKNGRKW